MRQDKILIDAVHRFGRHWKDIQRQHFQGRSKNCIKNRYVIIHLHLNLADVSSDTRFLFVVTKIKALRYRSLRAHPSPAPTQPQMTRICLTLRAHTTTCYLPALKCRPLKRNILGPRTVPTQVGLHKNPSTLSPRRRRITRPFTNRLRSMSPKPRNGTGPRHR